MYNIAHVAGGIPISVSKVQYRAGYSYLQLQSQFTPNKLTPHRGLAW